MCSPPTPPGTIGIGLSMGRKSRAVDVTRAEGIAAGFERGALFANASGARTGTSQKRFLSIRGRVFQLEEPVSLDEKEREREREPVTKTLPGRAMAPA